MLIYLVNYISMQLLFMYFQIEVRIIIYLFLNENNLFRIIFNENS